MNIIGSTSFREFFFQKKNSIIPKANYLKLQQSYKDSDKVVHAFFENLDDLEFYRTAILYNYHGYRVREYLQEGKQNVKDGFDEVDWSKFKKSLVLFFVDKDYDDLTNKPRTNSRNFFYTRWYSIENYLVTVDAFEIVLLQFFSKMLDDVKEKLITLFKTAHEHFNYRIKVLTRFILIFRIKNKEIDLDRIVMDDFMVIHEMQILEKKLIRHYNYEKIRTNPKSTSLSRRLIREDSIADILEKKCLADKGLISFPAIMKNDLLLNSVSEPKIYVRGKYELWFFTEIIKTIENAIAVIYAVDKIDEVKHPKPKRKIEVTIANAFHLISSKLTPSDELNYFLYLNFSKINESN